MPVIAARWAVGAGRVRWEPIASFWLLAVCLAFGATLPAAAWVVLSAAATSAGLGLANCLRGDWRNRTPSAAALVLNLLWLWQVLWAFTLGGIGD
jgi:hypothetical protein